jgi:elongation factor P--(R)-beta-lysine ligase
MDSEWKQARRRKALETRARLFQSIRDFFISRDYLEVETPIRIPAPAPESHIDAIPSTTWFLQTSPELCMKRMLAAGYPKIFQICKCFREKERGDLHLPEFTLLEWYRSGIDYRELMSECEEFFLHIVRELTGNEAIIYGSRQIDFSRPWERITVREAFQKYAGWSAEKAIEKSCFDQIMVRDIEPNLGGTKPVFLLDYPVSLGALARPGKDDSTVAERFEIYMGGMEMANGFSELTDVYEQEARFAKEREARRIAGKTVYPWPEKFLDALQAMPESAGIAVGMDRLVMIFSGAATIDDVVSFTPEEL